MNLIIQDSNKLIIEKLNAALSKESDFPTRAQIITELRKYTSNPNSPVEPIVELIMCEPSLASRILLLTNSVYYARGKEITTISQAITQLGFKGIYNLCANFVLLQKFSALTDKSTTFSNCFLISLLTSNISAYIDSKESKSKDEEGYLAGSLFSIGPLLLGFYFPKLFNEAGKRAERKKISIFKGVEEILGIPAVAVSLEIIKSLSVPDLYHMILKEALTLYNTENFAHTIPTSKSVCVGSLLSECIVESKSASEIKKRVEEICNKYALSYDTIFQYLVKIPSIIHTQKSLLDSPSCNFPEAFTKFIKGEADQSSKKEHEQDDLLSPYFAQIETAILESETIPSIIATAMEALSFACDFKRVLYLECNVQKTKLQGKLALGEDTSDIQSILVELSKGNPHNLAHLNSYYSGMVETTGKALYENIWPFVSIPVGYEDRALGVIYADSLSGDCKSIPPDKALSFAILSDLLDNAISKSRL